MPETDKGRRRYRTYMKVPGPQVTDRLVLPDYTFPLEHFKRFGGKSGVGGRGGSCDAQEGNGQQGKERVVEHHGDNVVTL